MIGTMVKQLTKNASIEEIEKYGLSPYYADHDKAVYPVSASGVPFTAAYIQSKGDPITDLMEDMAAEQKARSTYEYLINLADDPDVIEPLKFLREREVVHFQRFGEALRRVQDYLAEQRVFTVPDLSKVQGIRYSPNTSNTQTSPYANSQNTQGAMFDSSNTHVSLFSNTPNSQVSPYSNAPNSQVSPYSNAPNSQVSPYSNAPNSQVSPYSNAPNSQVSPYSNVPNSQVSPYSNIANSQVSPATQDSSNAQVSPYTQNAPDIQTMPSVRDSNIAGRDTSNSSNVQGYSDSQNNSGRYAGRYDNKYDSKHDKYDNKYDNRYRR